MTERSHAFRECVNLLRQLDRLMERGLGDEPEADTIRDPMNDRWFEMSEEEQVLANVLSADLFTRWDPPTQRAPALPEARARFAELRAAHNWVEALSLLHESPAIVDPPDAALFRVEAWMALGEYSVADEFLQLYQRLVPPTSRRSEPRRRGPELEYPRLSHRLSRQAA